jgi:outer membrane biosynthesis protein TonB
VRGIKTGAAAAAAVVLAGGAYAVGASQDRTPTLEVASVSDTVEAEADTSEPVYEPLLNAGDADPTVVEEEPEPEPVVEDEPAPDPTTEPEPEPVEPAPSDDPDPAPSDPEPAPEPEPVEDEPMPKPEDPTPEREPKSAKMPDGSTITDDSASGDYGNGGDSENPEVKPGPDTEG